LLDVKVGFTETDAPKVHAGQVATITLDAVPNKTFVGHVLELDTNSTLVSNVVTYYAKVGFNTAPAGVKPGMTASVNVVLDKRDDAITLPTSAVSTTGTTQTLTVKAKNGTESSRSVTIGLRGDSAVEITSGISAGEQVVITSSASTSGSGAFPSARLGGGGLGGGLGGGGAGR
jgi:macrolide-specific efflux system membrane fusion protein